jgi:hypothetical protein
MWAHVYSRKVNFEKKAETDNTQQTTTSITHCPFVVCNMSSSEDAILDNFLMRFRSKINSTIMPELAMYAVQGVPAFTFVRKIDRSIDRSIIVF